jgi:hypothetical protein
MPLKSLGIPAVVPALIDTAALDAGIGRCLLPTIEYLDLVTAHEIDAGVGILGDVDFDVGADVTELLLAEEMFRAAGGAVEHGSRPRRACEPLAIVGLEMRVSDYLPRSSVRVPGGEVPTGERHLVALAAILGRRAASDRQQEQSNDCSGALHG